MIEAAAIDALLDAVDAAQPVRSRRELTTEGREIAGPRLICSGWAARVRLLQDGRRQLLCILLPGDIIEDYAQSRPLAISTVVALTDVTVCTLPSPAPFPGLMQAYSVSRALDEAYLLAQVTRLGRLSAHERLGDFFLELYERLALSGLLRDHGIDFPMTQETLADTLGLTSVHINRVLQSMRRSNDLIWVRGRLQLTDPVALARMIGHVPARVTATTFPAGGMPAE